MNILPCLKEKQSVKLRGELPLIRTGPRKFDSCGETQGSILVRMLAVVVWGGRRFLLQETHIEHVGQVAGNKSISVVMTCSYAGAMLSLCNMVSDCISLTITPFYTSVSKVY